MNNIYRLENTLRIKAERRRDRAMASLSDQAENIFKDDFMAPKKSRAIDLAKVARG